MPPHIRDRSQLRVSHLTFTIGSGREPSLRREVLGAALLDVFALVMFGVLDVQRARVSGLTWLTLASQVLLVLLLAHGQVPLWRRVILSVRRGEAVEEAEVPPMAPGMLRVWLTVPIILLGGSLLLAAAQLMDGIRAGHPDWLGIGVIAFILWFLWGMAQAPVVGLPQEGGDSVGGIVTESAPPDAD